jgi:hypothetical protein
MTAAVFARRAGAKSGTLQIAEDTHMANKPELKQFRDLTAADFRRHRVWVHVHIIDYDEPWYNDPGVDEETFRPWLGDLPVWAGDAIYLLSAQMTLADGRVLEGFVSPESDGDKPDMGLTQPNVFLPSGRRCAFWNGVVKRPEQLRPFYAELGKDPRAIFPIRYKAADGLAKGRTEGVIPGFCWLSEGVATVYH